MPAAFGRFVPKGPPHVTTSKTDTVQWTDCAAHHSQQSEAARRCITVTTFTAARGITRKLRLEGFEPTKSKTVTS